MKLNRRLRTVFHIDPGISNPYWVFNITTCELKGKEFVEKSSFSQHGKQAVLRRPATKSSQMNLPHLSR